MKKLAFTICLLALFLPFHAGLAFDLPKTNYPKLANLFWKTPIDQNEASALAKWDLVVLDMQAQTESANSLKLLRKLNPKIIILAYTSANEIHEAGKLKIVEPKGTGLWHELAKGAKDQWQLKTYNGEKISWWPGNISMNLYAQDENGRTYADYLVDFYEKKVLATGLWDGLFFDNVWQNVSWVDKNIDIDADGQADSADKINRLWQAGNANLFKKLREKFGDKYLIVGNGDGQYHTYLNGREFEGFPEFFEGGWTGQMKQYALIAKTGQLPRLNVINSDTDNTGDKNDFPKMRYGLTSTLLYDGYYSFDFGTELREQLWWYDEYDINLGQPKNPPVNLLAKNDSNLKAGVWQRDFTNGIVLVNSTAETKTINFDAEYETIHGQQDPDTNNGTIVGGVTLNPEDGIILWRPIDEVKNAVFSNGAFARVFNALGQNTRTGFFTYDSAFKGGNKIIKADINDDGQIETVAADENEISIYSQAGEKIKTFFPYGRNYQNGITLAVADLNRDNQLEIATGSENGYSSAIKIFNFSGEEINSGWSAFGYGNKNIGVSVAIGDTNGDGEKEIIAAAGKGAAPRVKIFNKNGKLISNGFMAYGSNFKGGVNAASGDVNGDGVDEIITGAGLGGGPQVRIFNQSGRVLGQWFAYNAQSREGVKVVANDLDGDGQAEVVALTTNVFTQSGISQNDNQSYDQE